MSHIFVCPDRQQLERLLLGAVNQEEAATLDGHLLDCERCCHVLGELEASDTLAGTLRTVGARQPALDDRVRAFMAQLREITLPGKAFEETLARGGEATEDAWELEKLLDPPQAEGELGRFGDYRVLRVLGAGGMGLVFEAEDPRLRRRVALKVMKPALAARDEHHQRFLREARAAAAIEHPHIVTVYQVGEHRGLPFLAMQLLKGEALDDRLRREPRLPVDECLRIGRETAEALAEAHQRNLIHRDIKPANIWLEGASGWVKLVDFGLAHAAEDVHLTQTGAILGTPAYMSPEQARGEAVDGRSDLYSLGAVLYKLTTGDVPFRGANTMAVLMALATETPRRPSQINPDIPPALDDLIVRLLKKEPHERLQSVQGVAEAIRAIEQQSSTHEDKGPKPDGGTGRRRPRWQFIAAAAAAFLLLAAIVIIVRDRKGNEVARLQVPDDGSITVSDDKTDKGGAAASTNSAPALREGNAARAAGSPPRSIGTTLPEPPPLGEWLKGREVLTVAQDGSGQFKTIQAALNALKPHQVVKVLDRGPYRESIRTGGLPNDTGLISDQQATVETPAWPDDGVGHAIGPSEKFRLSGIRFVAPPRNSWGAIVVWGESSGLVIEDCCFGMTAPQDPAQTVAAMFFAPENEALDESATVVRGCLFEFASLEIAGNVRSHSAFVVERNYFRKSNVGLGRRLDQAIFRHNVFDGAKECFWIHELSDIGRVLEISNNTATTGVSVVHVAPARGVVLHNNVTEHDVAFDGEAYKLRAEIAKNWQRDHNSYLRRPLLAKSQSDVMVEPAFLSIEPTDRNYLRLPADGPQAVGGAGGDLPRYMGALPPGPAPKDGDWFTRLRERWLPDGLANDEIKPAAIPPPLEIPEPPPLDEWLKGREVLTVAQDGSGQFKTIQAALDALQPGQVIKVLDAGPYHERLEMDDVPADTGLVSDKGTVLELPAYVLHYKDAEHEYLKGHLFGDTDTFRVAGFTLRFPPRPHDRCSGLQTHRGGGFVLERCRVQSPAVVIIGYHAGGSTKLSCIRECRIEGRLDVGSVDNDQAATLVTRNLFSGNEGVAHVGVDSVYKYVGIRGNVFANPWQGFEVHSPKQLARLEINNNTFLGGDPILFVRSVATGEVIVCNNLRLRAGLLALVWGAEKQRDEAIPGWHIAHNGYPRALDPDEKWTKEQIVPPAAGDLLGTPKFISKIAGDRDYLRPRADDPVANAGVGSDWPSYTGALPPGPAPTEGDWFTRLLDRWK